MILINGDSFTYGAELDNPEKTAWPSLIKGTKNIAISGASNDHIMYSTVDYILKAETQPKYVIVAWTSPNRIEISGKQITAASGGHYGYDLVNAIFRDWDEDWARLKFLNQIQLLSSFLEKRQISFFYVSTFDIQSWAPDIPVSNYLGWPREGILEWVRGYPRAPHGHPLELGHQRIAEKINEHIRHLGWTV